MQALYQAETSGAATDEIMADLSSREDYLKETVDFAGTLARGAWEARARSDEIITKYARDWTVDRMGKVVVSIFRLAIYELSNELDTPQPVVIDEAVELAKKFSTAESAKFINGVLGSFLKEQR
jgi:N utilization substance protein B